MMITGRFGSTKARSITFMPLLPVMRRSVSTTSNGSDSINRKASSASLAR